jgi:AcrR family transcriptional regulator
MKQQKTYFGISELSRHTAVPVSTIKYYIRKDLLPSPIKTSKTMAYYTSAHVEKLRLIKKLQKEKNYSLEQIKEAVQRTEESRTETGTDLPGRFSRRRAEIIEAAIDVFRMKGYGSTTMDDIATAAHISKSTFYSHFENKKELFIQCFEKIFDDSHRKTWNHLEDESDFAQMFRNQFLAFYKEYPKWSDMMNLLRAVAINNPKDFKDKVTETMRMTTEHIANQVDRGIEQGTFRQVHSQLAGVMFLGMLDYFCYFLSQGKFEGSQTMLIDVFLDIAINGINAPMGEIK